MKRDKGRAGEGEERGKWNGCSLSSVVASGRRKAHGYNVAYKGSRKDRERHNHITSSTRVFSGEP